jgi:hypothetical protein
MNCFNNGCNNEVEDVEDGRCSECIEVMEITRGIFENGWTLEDCPIDVARFLNQYR